MIVSLAVSLPVALVMGAHTLFSGSFVVVLFQVVLFVM